MAIFTAVTNDADGRARVTCNVAGISNDPANNRTLVRVTGSVSDNSASFGGFGTGTWSITLDGVSRGSGSQAYDFTGDSGRSYTFAGGGDFWITHNTNGTRSVSASVVFSGVTPVGSATASGSITLTDYNRSPVFTTSNAPTPAIKGVAYTGQFTATNTSSYSRSGTLPPGLSFNTTTGALTGTPTTVGSYTFTISATGTFEGITSVSKTVVVNPPLPVFTDATIEPIAIRGVAYSDGVMASDADNYSISSSSLPTGLNFNTLTGAITGTPTTLQSRNPVFRATNANGFTETSALPITVNPPAPVFSDSTVLAQASIGSFYSDAVVASDVASYSVFSGALPDGITLNTSTGVISGTPTTAGVYSFVISATNVTGDTNTPERTITVISPVRVWSGSGFVIGSLRVWNSTDFVSSSIRVWNGTTWVSAK